MIENNKYESENLKKTKPFIFTKKVNNNHKIIPLHLRKNDMGLTRYFPPATQEWGNSVYSYNNNLIKNLKSADKVLNDIFRSYFNLYLKAKKLRYKAALLKAKRISKNRIYFSRAEVKHTVDKAVITVYIYNEERRVLMKKFKKMDLAFFPKRKKLIFTKKKLIPSLKTKMDGKFKQNFKFFKNSEEFLTYLGKKIEILKNKHKKGKKALPYIRKLKLRFRKRRFLVRLEKIINKLIFLNKRCLDSKSVLAKVFKSYKENIFRVILKEDIKKIVSLKKALDLNKIKFEDTFLREIKPLVYKIYKKDIEFNFVNLKSYYLNSDIFTEIIASKLKNRKNKVLKTLKLAIKRVKLPLFNKLKESYSGIILKNLLVNKSKNLKIFRNSFNISDSLNSLLLDLFPNSSFLLRKREEKSRKKISENFTLLNYVLKNLKHKNVGGVRIETRGRLTKRFTASRSLFKVKWKGSIKNIDSSYKGLSTVMLRGHFKSNLQYSKVKGKARLGAFGVKGWVSSK